MKTFLQGLVVFEFLAFLALVIIGTIHSEMSYRYRITVPDGRYSTHYYTDGYVKRTGCVRFRNSNATDSTEVCGMYTVSQLR
jgi:hypothetical protein